MRENPVAPASRRAPLSPYAQRDPFALFRTEVDRLFEDFFAPARGFAGFDFTPALDVSETEKEIRLTADLPGVDEKDVEISLDGDVLTLKGEKREERKEDGENRRLFERSYGVFERSIRLPFAPTDEACKATFKNGVLTVAIAKPATAATASKRIPIGS